MDKAQYKVELKEVFTKHFRIINNVKKCILRCTATQIDRQLGRDKVCYRVAISYDNKKG